MSDQPLILHRREQMMPESVSSFTKREWVGLVGGIQSPTRSRNTTHSLLQESRERLSLESREKNTSRVTGHRLEARLVSILVFFNFNWKETSYSKNITRRSDIAFAEKKNV